MFRTLSSLFTIGIRAATLVLFATFATAYSDRWSGSVLAAETLQEDGSGVRAPAAQTTVGGGAVAGGTAGGGAVRSPMTIAERSNYLATSRGSDVAEFLAALDADSPHAKLVQYGATNEQRPLWSLVVSREENVQLPLPADDPRLVIVMIGGIHSGECDSKEALLALARDVLQQETPKYLDRAVLVFAPNFNADGNERVGLLHRPGQEGPALGMGTRENAVGQDLNRDFIKLDSPEVRSLVRMIDAWEADVLIDAHTTNGSLHRYDMTYDMPHNPAANPQVLSWMREELFPVVSKKMSDQGAPVFYYGNFNRDHTVWESYGFEPRYSTEYMGLRGKIGILVESYSYATYQRRIEVSYAFIDACLEQLTQQSARIQSLIQPSSDQPPREVAIQGKIVADDAPAKVAAYAWPTQSQKDTEEATKGNAPVDRDHATNDPARQDPTSRENKPSARAVDQPASPTFPSPKDRGAIKDMVETEYTVTVVNRGESILQVDAPEYYYIPEECAWAASRIRLHGIPMIRVDGSANASAEQYTIASRKEANEFQFRKMSRYAVNKQAIDAKLGSGWLVPTNHALGVLATYVLEPHSDESLAMWGFLDPALREGSTYPVLRLSSKPNFEKSFPLPKLAWLEMVPKDIVGERLSLEKLFDPQQRVSYSGMPTPMPRWAPNGESYLTQRENRWFQIDCATGSMQPFDRLVKLVEALGKLPGLGDGAAAPYGRQLGIFDESLQTALIRHQNDLYFYDAEVNKATRLTETPDDEEELYALSPTRGHVAFVRNQNLWVVDCKTGDIKPLTTDGGGEILNGKLDWVYQEEIYGRGQFKAYWWNPDGTKIAYLRLDESPVPNFIVDNSLGFAQKIENMRYPKAGQNNPLVTLHVVDVATGRDTTVPIERFEEKDRLVVRVGWKPEQPYQVVYQVQNRIQNQLDVVLFDLQKETSQTLVHEESKAWIDVIDVPRWLPDGSFLWLSDADGGRRHIHLISAQGERRPLTRGDWDVKEISAIADAGKSVWFTAHRSAPTNTDVLRLSLETGVIESMSNLPGSHRISVHPSGSYFMDSWSDMTNPAQLWLRGRDGQPIRSLSGYRSDRFDYVKTAEVELLEIPARDGQAMPAMLYRPAAQSGSTAAKAPVLIHVYGGPAAPTVENAWTHRSDLWHRYLARQGIAVLLCDNRSALGRGNSDTWKIYRNLGDVELRDLEDAARWIGTQDWADPDRIGLWGWSYGGYFTAYALTHSKLFHAGIAGAPVTDWRNYDSVYTERYMDTPQSNPSGYESSSVVAAAKDLHGRLLLIHGEIDDNVHMANSMQLVHALQKAGKPFELMVYPNNRHGISDPQQTFHQYQMMTDFVRRNLGDRLNANR
jgi:dipeptidyl-peptidase 4